MNPFFAGKILAGVGWIASLGSLAMASHLPSEWVMFMTGVLWVMLGAHCVECVILLVLWKRRDRPPWGPLFGTFLFGAFYMVPFLRSLPSAEAGSGD